MKKDTVLPAMLIFCKYYVGYTKIHGKEKKIDEIQVLFYARKNCRRERVAKTPKF